MKAAHRAFALLALTCLISGAVQAASRELLASPLLAYAWMPWKNEAGVWQKPADTQPDFSKMTLTDLPPPELYLQVALTSPYPVPQVPLNLIVNNTIASLNSAILPATAKDWVQMAGNAGSYVTQSLPLILQGTLQTVMQGLTVDGKPLNELPGLKDAPLDAAHALRALPQLLNLTMAGVELNKLTTLAEQLHIKLPKLSNEFNSSIEELKKIPALLPKNGLTVEDIMKLPSILEQVTSAASNAADAFGKQVQGIQLPKIEEFFDDASALSLRKWVEKQLSIELPRSGPVEQVLLNVTKALPALASQLGIKVEGLDRLPGVIEALDQAFNAAKKDGLLITDRAGRIDVVASLAQLPDKVPLVQKVVNSMVPPPADLPGVQASLEKLQKSLSRLNEISAVVLSPTKRTATRQNHV